MQRNLYACTAGTVLIPSPLLDAGLPDWMSLHFQTTPEGNWQSPQVLKPALAEGLRRPGVNLDLCNVTPERAAVLLDLKAHFPSSEVFARLPEGSDVQVVSTEPPSPDSSRSRKTLIRRRRL